jgi:hypothetical protein
VQYSRPPSAHQNCSQAPQVSVPKTTTRSLRKLRRAKWRLAVGVQATGIGKLKVTLTPRHHGRKAHALVSVSRPLSASGRHVVKVAIPAAARHPGSFVLRLTTTSPDGKGHASTATTLELVR